MINIIRFLRNLARFIEDRAEGCKQHGYKKLSQKQEANRKAFAVQVNQSAVAWEREAVRHRESIERIRAEREQISSTYDSNVDNIAVKLKHLDLS